MMTLDVICIEDQLNANVAVLTQPAMLVTFPLSQEDKDFIQALKEKVIELGGVGLAAPQVGVPKQIIGMMINEDAKSLRHHAEVVPLTILINPDYRPAEEATTSVDWEACFSVRDTYGKVPRYNSIYYTAQTESGERIVGVAEGFTARVLQHEIDHIRGLLITHRLTPDCVFGAPDEMMSLRMKEFTPEQREKFETWMAQKKK